MEANTKIHVAIAQAFAARARSVAGVLDVLAAADGDTLTVYAIVDDLDMERELHLQALFIEASAQTDAPDGNLIVLLPDDGRPSAAFAI